MQAEAVLAHTRFWIATATIATIFWAAAPASAQNLPTPGHVVLTVPLPSPGTDVGTTQPTSSATSSGTSGGADATGTAAQASAVKCRGCVPPGALMPSSDRSSASADSDAAPEAAPEVARAKGAATGAPAPSAAPFETTITIPGFGLVVGLVALFVILRHRRR